MDIITTLASGLVSVITGNPESSLLGLTTYFIGREAVPYCYRYIRNRFFGVPNKKICVRCGKNTYV